MIDFHSFIDDRHRPILLYKQALANKLKKKTLAIDRFQETRSQPAERRAEIDNRTSKKLVNTTNSRQWISTPSQFNTLILTLAQHNGKTCQVLHKTACRQMIS